MLEGLRIKLRKIKLYYSLYKGKLSGINFPYTLQRVCWVIGTPNHKNLGDHAIAYATLKYLSKSCPGLIIREIDEGEFYKCFVKMKQHLKKGDFIVLQGGGNLGNQYQYIEDMRRLVISQCTSVPIILFPQTITFSNDRIGKAELKETIHTYSKNQKLYLIAREKVSYTIMRELFPNNRVLCTPDIVLTLHDLNIHLNERNGIICCLRNDVESVLSQDEKLMIINTLKEVSSVQEVDTMSEVMIPKEKRLTALRYIWTKFSTAELIVTDRLHGMIFSVITNTPCIVFENYNHKLIGTYDWLKDTNFVCLINDPVNLNVEVIKKTMKQRSNSDALENILNSFTCLTGLLQEVNENG